MRLVFIGEGDRDVGRADMHRVLEGDFEGDLPRIVRRVLLHHGGPRRFGYEALTISSVVSKIPRSGRAMRTGAKGKSLRDAVIACVRSTDLRPDVVIALIDARRDELAGLRDDARETLRQCREERGDVDVVIGLAVQEVEIWLVADPTSCRAAFGAGTSTRGIPSALEEVFDPKKLWLEHAGRAPVPEGIAPDLFEDTQRARALEELDPDLVAQRCPLGFAPFNDDLRLLVGKRFTRAAS